MLNKNAIEGLINSTPEKRYKSFLNTVTDLEEVWLLCSNEGYATFDEDGFINVLLWPQKEFCDYFISNNEEAVSIEIHDFLEKCKELDDTIRFMIFPTNVDSYVVTIEKLCLDIQEHLDELE